MAAYLGKIRSGIGWGGLSTASTVLMQIAFVSIAARLLKPADFGLMALATVALRFLSYFSQVGIVPAVVQKEELTEGDVAAALAVSMVISTLCFAVIVCAAPLIAGAYGVPRLSLVLQFMAATFVIYGMTAVSTGLLRRSLRFRAISFIESSSYAFGYGAVGLSCAMLGFGVWALVVASLAQAVFSLVASYLATRHSLRMEHSREERRHFLAFGSRYSLLGFLEFLTSNLDTAIIGRLFGPAFLGVYNRALVLSNLPVEKPANVITKTLFPVLCSMSEERDRRRVVFHLGLLSVSGFAFAVSAGISMSADAIVLTLLGRQWSDSIPVLRVLALSVGPIFTSHVICVTLDSMGVLSQKIAIQLFCLAVLGVLFWQFSGHGLIGFAWAVVLVEWMRAAIYVALMKRKLGGTSRDWLATALAVPLVAGSVAGATWCSVQLDLGAGTPPINLFTHVSMAAAGLIAGSYFARPVLRQSSSVRWLSEKNRLVSRLVGWVSSQRGD